MLIPKILFLPKIEAPTPGFGPAKFGTVQKCAIFAIFCAILHNFCNFGQKTQNAQFCAFFAQFLDFWGKCAIFFHGLFQGGAKSDEVQHFQQSCQKLLKFLQVGNQNTRDIILSTKILFLLEIDPAIPYFRSRKFRTFGKCAIFVQFFAQFCAISRNFCAIFLGRPSAILPYLMAKSI